MLESIFTQAGALTLANVLTASAAALILGLIIACIYMLNDNYTKNFVITLSLLPALVGIVIMLVNGELGTSVAILGSFSLVRFRSLPGSSKEIAFIFFAMAVGLATGMGFIVFAAIITVMIGLVFTLLNKLNFGGSTKSEKKELRITIPEDLDYTGIFDDLFEEYTSFHDLHRVKTTNMGSMFELFYSIKLKDATKEKAFIDDLRCRNGNLTIILNKAERNPDLYL